MTMWESVCGPNANLPGSLEDWVYGDNYNPGVKDYASCSCDDTVGDQYNYIYCNNRDFTILDIRREYTNTLQFDKPQGTISARTQFFDAQTKKISSPATTLKTMPFSSPSTIPSANMVDIATVKSLASRAVERPVIVAFVSKIMDPESDTDADRI